MKTLKNKLSAILVIVFVSTMFLACEEDPDKYEVRLRNNAHSEAFGLVPVKYDITKFTIGDITVENIAYGEFSEFFTIKSKKEYNLYVEYNQYLFDLESNSWLFDGSFSDDLGTEEWSNDECDPQRITITIRGLLGLPVGAQYDVYCEN